MEGGAIPTPNPRWLLQRADFRPPSSFPFFFCLREFGATPSTSQILGNFSKMLIFFSFFFLFLLFVGVWYYSFHATHISPLQQVPLGTSQPHPSPQPPQNNFELSRISCGELREATCCRDPAAGMG